MPPIRNNNFVNTVNNELENLDPVKVFLSTLLIVSIFTGVSFFFTGYFFEYKIKKSLEEITLIDQKLNTLPLKDMSDLSLKISTVDLTQKDKNNISPILAVLSDSVERYTYLTDLSFSDKGTKGAYLNLKGVAQSYEDIIKQTDKLKSSKYKPLIKSVNLLEIATKPGENNIKFSLDIEFDSKSKVSPLDILEKNYDPSKKTVRILINSSSTDPFEASSTSNISTSTLINKNI